MLYSSNLGNISLGSFQLGETGSGITVFEDSLNNWGDSFATDAPIPPIEVSDNLNNWNVSSGGGFSSVLGEISLGLFTLNEIGSDEEAQLALLEGDSKTVNLADNLENYDEALIIGIGLAVGDTNAANWNDAFTNDYLIFTFNQTINVASSLATRPGPGNSPPRDAWKDGVNYTLAPFADIDISAEDLETFLSAYAQLGIGLIFSDDADNWADANVTSGFAGVFAFDSMFFNIFDEAKVALGLPASVSDSLNNLSDAISISLVGGASVGDALNFNDNVNISFTTLPSPGDSLSLNDALGLIIGVGFSFSDDANNLADLFLNSPASTTLTNSEDDTMSMDDNAEAELNATLTSYLRRYLNDVVN